MIDLGIGLTSLTALARGGGVSGPEILPANSALMVAGDSIGTQATQNAHPLVWAMREADLAIGYDYTKHNIAVGSTTFDSNAATNGFTYPAPGGGTALGLLHPDRLARDKAYAAAHNPSVLFLAGPTNSRLLASAVLIACIETYFAELQSVAPNLQYLILDGIGPVQEGTTLNTAGEAATIRANNAALEAYAAANPSWCFWVGGGLESERAPGDDGDLYYAPMGGYQNLVDHASTGDGKHWSAALAVRLKGYYIAVLQQIFPPRSVIPYSLVDLYDRTSNFHGNALGQRAGFVDADGSTFGIVTGTVPKGYFVYAASTGGTETVVSQAEVMADFDGALRECVEVTVGGATSGELTIEVFADWAVLPVGSYEVKIGTSVEADRLIADGAQPILHGSVIEFEDLVGCFEYRHQYKPAVGTVGGEGSYPAGLYPALNGRFFMRHQIPQPLSRPDEAGKPTIILRFAPGKALSGKFRIIRHWFGHWDGAS